MKGKYNKNDGYDVEDDDDKAYNADAVQINQHRHTSTRKNKFMHM